MGVSKKQDLQDFSRQQMDILANISHSVRTPIHTIMGMTDLALQDVNDPIAVDNYLCKIKKAGSVLINQINELLELTRLENNETESRPELCTFETIKHFGFQSGRDVDKFGNITPPTDCNDVPYLGWQSCAVISGKVVEQHDLGTHTLFIAEVVDAKVLSDKEPITYAKYQNEIKPKNNAASAKEDGKKIVGWRCKICNYVYEGSKLPEDYACPLCGHGADDFEPIYES